MNRTVFLGVDLGQSAVRCYHAPLHHLKTVPSVQIVHRKFQCLSSQSRRFVTQQIWLHQVCIRRKHETSAAKTQYGLHIAFSRSRRVAVACASERKATIVNLKATSCASSGSYCIRCIRKALLQPRSRWAVNNPASTGILSPIQDILGKIHAAVVQNYDIIEPF